MKMMQISFGYQYYWKNLNRLDSCVLLSKKLESDYEMMTHIN